MLNAEQRQRGRDIANQLKDILKLDSCYFSQPKKDKKRVRFYLKSGASSLSVPIAKHVIFNKQYDFTPTVLQTVIRAWITELEHQQSRLDGGTAVMIKRLAGVH